MSGAKTRAGDVRSAACRSAPRSTREKSTSAGLEAVSFDRFQSCLRHQCCATTDQKHLSSASIIVALLFFLHRAPCFLPLPSALTSSAFLQIPAAAFLDAIDALAPAFASLGPALSALAASELSGNAAKLRKRVTAFPATARALPESRSSLSTAVATQLRAGLPCGVEPRGATPPKPPLASLHVFTCSCALTPSGVFSSARPPHPPIARYCPAHSMQARWTVLARRLRSRQAASPPPPPSGLGSAPTLLPRPRGPLLKQQQQQRH